MRKYYLITEQMSQNVSGIFPQLMTYTIETDEPFIRNVNLNGNILFLMEITKEQFETWHKSEKVEILKPETGKPEIEVYGTGKLANLLEAVADIAYNAGHDKLYTGDSRGTIAMILNWAKEFNELHKSTDWNEVDYIETVDNFSAEKLKEYE